MLLVVTTETVPGYRVESVLGPVVGLTLRSRNPWKAGLATLDGGSNPEALAELIRTRHEAITELARAAKERGGNAIIGMRFDHRQVSNSTAEICAYGTAVVVVPDAAPLHQSVPPVTAVVPT